MRALLKRWWFWVGAVLLLGLLGAGIALTMEGGNRTQAKFDSIQEGMTLKEVEDLLGQHGYLIMASGSVRYLQAEYDLEDGPNWIQLYFTNNRLRTKKLHLASTWAQLKWRCQQLRDRIGL
jgi:hypothetical protein